MSSEQSTQSKPASEAGGQDSLRANARLAELRGQQGIKPDSGVPKKLDAKALKKSLSANSEKRCAENEKRLREAEACERDSRKASRLVGCGIPKRHRNHRGLSGERWLACADRIADMAGSGFLVALIGDRGRGKTQMGVVVVGRYIEDDKGSARYVKAMDFFMAIRQTYGKDTGTTERDVINEFSKCKLLVIDAIEVRSETPWEDRLLNHLIDLRYDNCLDTLLIGNIAKDDLTSALGHSIASRANETGGVIVCEWPSYREAKK